MLQILNLIFDKHFFWIQRSSRNSAVLLHHQSIDSRSSFFKENLKEVIRNNHQNPEKISIYYSPEKYTLIPANLFLPSKTQNYFNLNFGQINSEETIHYETIVSMNLIVIYSIPVWLNELKSEINSFGEIKSTLGKQLFLLEKEKESTLANCVLNEGWMDVCVKSDGKLVLANQYEINNENDLVYFLLLINKKLDIADKATITLYNNGSELSNNQIKNLLDSIQDFNQIKFNFSDSQSYFKSILCE